jgi:hypothetical protein
MFLDIGLRQLLGGSSLTRPRSPRGLRPSLERLEDRTVPTAFNYKTFSDIEGLTLNGNAAQVGDKLRLVPGDFGQVGSAFFNQSVQTAKSFSTRFEVKMSGGSAPFADGMVFMFQNDPRGLNSLAGAGGFLGYDGFGDESPTANSVGVNGFPPPIEPSVGVELDIFTNEWDPNNNHIAVDLNGDVEVPVAVTTPSFSLYGQKVRVWVDYNAESHHLKVFAADGKEKPLNPLLDTELDLSEIVGPHGFVGFSAATGGLNANHDVLSWKFSNGSSPPSTPPAGSSTPTSTARMSQLLISFVGDEKQGVETLGLSDRETRAATKSKFTSLEVATNGRSRGPSLPLVAKPGHFNSLSLNDPLAPEPLGG